MRLALIAIVLALFACEKEPDPVPATYHYPDAGPMPAAKDVCPALESCLSSYDTACAGLPGFCLKKIQEGQDCDAKIDAYRKCH